MKLRRGKDRVPFGLVGEPQESQTCEEGDQEFSIRIVVDCHRDPRTAIERPRKKRRKGRDDARRTASSSYNRGPGGTKVDNYGWLNRAGEKMKGYFQLGAGRVATGDHCKGGGGWVSWEDRGEETDKKRQNQLMH